MRVKNQNFLQRDHDGFIEACRKGDHVRIQKWCEQGDSSIDSVLRSALDQGFVAACRHEQAGVIYEIMREKVRKGERALLRQWVEGLLDECSYNNRGVSVKALLFGWKELVSRDAEDSLDDHSGISWACEKGHVDLVKWWVESEELRAIGYPTVSLKKICETSRAFTTACLEGKLEMVDYMLNRRGDEFSVYNHQGMGWIFACEGGHLEMVQYLSLQREKEDQDQEKQWIEEDIEGKGSPEERKKRRELREKMDEEGLLRACKGQKEECVRWLVMEWINSETVKKVAEGSHVDEAMSQVLDQYLRTQEEFAWLGEISEGDAVIHEDCGGIGKGVFDAKRGKRL